MPVTLSRILAPPTPPFEDGWRSAGVKCDASRPFCSPCLKSARGDTSVAQSKCKYEGTSVAAAREQAAQAARESGATMGVGMGGKRKRASNVGAGTGKKAKEVRRESQDAEDDDEEELDALVRGEKRGRLSDSYANPAPLPLPPHLQGQQQQHPGYPPPPQHHQQHQQHQQPYPSPTSSYYGGPPPPPASASSAYTPHASAPPSQPGIVEELTGRVAQLERQLQQQADAHAAHLTSAAPFNPYAHTRSPSFPYASTPNYPAPPGSASGGNNNGNGNGNGNGQYQLPPLSAALPAGGVSLNPPGFDIQGNLQAPTAQLPPPSSAGGALLPPLSAGGAGAERTSTGSGGMFSYPTPSHSAGGPPSASLSASAAANGFNLPPYPSASFSPRPLTGSGLSAGARTPLPSLSALASAAGAAGGEFSFGGVTSASWSPGSAVAESNLRGGAPVAAPSPMSSLRRLVASGEDGNEGEGGKRDVLAAADSPRGSLWGITGNGAAGSAAAKGYAVVDTSSASFTSASVNGGASTTTTPASASTAATTDAAAVLEQALLPSFLSAYYYPASFPPPRTLSLLLHNFFARATVPSSMLDRASILASVDMGGWGMRGLEEGLVHAMCAYGGFYISKEGVAASEEEETRGAEGLGLALDGEGEGGEGEKNGRRKGKHAPYWMKEGDESAIAYHYRMAKKCVEKATIGGGMGEKGSDLFQVLQATILLCYIAYLTCSFTDLWLLSGTATRLCTPLGLSHLDAWDFEHARCGRVGEDWGVRVRFAERKHLMPPPQTLDEHWRRSVTFWLAFAVDRWASASTDWSTSIDEKDISTHLPCAAPMSMPSLAIDRRTGQIPSLSISSPTFLTDLSAPIGPLGLYIKATVLLGRVVNYLQRLPRARCVDVGGNCAEVKARLKATPEFIELDVALSQFKATHSANFYDATGSSIDGFRTSAYVIPHIATILLHEAFTDRQAQGSTASNARCLIAAKCVVNAMFVLYQSSSDLGGCDPFLIFCWGTTGRALVRDYATRRSWADTEENKFTKEAEASKTLAENCMAFIRECGRRGSKMADVAADVLQGHLDDPDALLPFDGHETWAVSTYLETL
ncbi:hypothetical protein JCM11251_006565 [Rhodosporidiobolus azoricus]